MKKLISITSIILLVFLIGIISGEEVFAARVHGTIYDGELEPLNKVVVVVNSSPMQRHISKYGGYSFELSPGKYRINATLSSNNISKTIASETVMIKSKEGDYNIDLFIYPGTNLSELFQEKPEETDSLWVILLMLASFIAVIGLFIITIIFSYKKKINQSVNYNIEYDPKDVDNVSIEENVERETNVSVDNKDENDPLKKKIITILEETDKISQKDIRKRIPLSESKISSTISELTKAGIIDKQKKGRINYILLKKKS